MRTPLLGRVFLYTGIILIHFLSKIILCNHNPLLIRQRTLNLGPREQIHANLTSFLRTLRVQDVDNLWFVPGGVLPENVGRGVRPASQNPYPFYDQKSAIFPTLFMT